MSERCYHGVTSRTERGCVDDLPVIDGDCQQMRDFTEVADILDANQTVQDSDAADGDAVNIGCSDTSSIREVAETMRE